YSALFGSVEDVHRYARDLAERLEKKYPKLIVSRMDKSVRRRKVLIDWSQNNAAKTTVAPYSLRGRDEPTVSTPVTWDEVEATGGGQAPLQFDFADVLDRVDAHGDLLAPLHDEAYALPSSTP